ncbi:tetratricopeptide repeat protein [Xanthovirga aplysinae]|uniref:tetratricopeptide repeat protein n=1 Tax=Xanthovirga aplysinae TaxID=2529853 RepID=UPI0012BC0112|nr:hypothetical protein [Xanthovirga aplysinae]MTI30500.1 hypothetical protein [Xanthovirga aplysinae]
MKKNWLFILVFVLGCADKKEGKKEGSFFNEKTYSKKELIKRANSSYEKDNFKESIRYFTHLINIDSLNGEYYFKRGYSYSDIDSLEASIADYLIAIRMDYRAGSAYLNMGLNYTVLLDDSLALFCYYKSLQFASDKEKIWNLMAESKKSQEERNMRRNESTLFSEMMDSIKFEHRKRLTNHVMAKDEIKNFFEEYEQWAKVF